MSAPKVDREREEDIEENTRPKSLTHLKRNSFYQVNSISMACRSIIAA